MTHRASCTAHRCRDCGAVYKRRPNACASCAGRKGAAVRNRTEGPPSSGGPTSTVFLERIRIDKGGYAPGGKYYGTGAPLYAAEDESGAWFTFFRASDRAAAKAKLRAQYPSIKFRR